MKKRNGFVSNSSSCSFIAVGLIIKKDDLDKEKVLKEVFKCDQEKIDEYKSCEGGLNKLFHKKFCDNSIYDFKYDSEMGYEPEEGYVFLCETLKEWNDEDEDLTGEYSFEELQVKVNKIKETFNVDGEVKLITGVRMC